MTFIVIFFSCLIIIPILIGIIVIFINRNVSSKKKVYNNSFFPSLLFHSIDDISSLEQSNISVNKFEQLLKFLKNKNYQSLSAFELYTYNKNNVSTKKAGIALLFDDGFENFYTKALPLLEQYQIKVSIFPVVNCINSNSSWDVYKPKRHLSKLQIQKISEYGHEIGSHTLSHPDLVLLSDRKIKYELTVSKKILEDIIGKPINTISFPFGSWNNKIWNLAEEIGYKVGVIYRNHIYSKAHIISPTGVYAFDSIEDIIEKIEYNHIFSPIHSRDIIMPHFAKGTALWRFRKSYNLLNYFNSKRG